VNLALVEVAVQYEQVHALDGLTLDVPLGSQLVIWGPAGGGKTTALKVMAGLIAPTRGTVTWGQRLVASLDRVEKRREQAHLGMVFQSDALFDSRTVIDNVLFPLIRRGVTEVEARERAVETLTRVGLANALDKTPETLSGGMRKRVGVARAIVAGPTVLLADDPFAGLDPKTERSIGELLLEVSAGKTLVVAVPDPPSAFQFARQVQLRDGRVVA
jgi:phospholipid/cholesterol/gamma-HCH transport system ATP-binding protein